MRRETIALAATGLLSAGCVEPPLRPRDPTPGVPHFSVTTFNVNLDMARDRATIAAVGAADADVVCLEESNATWEASLRAAYGRRYPYMLFRNAGRSAGGLAVLSRFPLHDEDLVPAFHASHPAWHVVVESPMGPVRLLVVHLRPLATSKEGYVTSYLNVDQEHAQEITYIEDHCQKDLPTLVLGDFNEDDDGAAVSYLCHNGFTDALSLFHPGQETWRMPSLLDQAVLTLDHVLYDEHFRPLNAYVMEVGNSDHMPVTVVVEQADQGR
jgi:endonuclease/exonuclease/phosphatase family metal-dependent hydrolase